MPDTLTPARRLRSPLRVALVVGLLAAVAAGGLIWRVEQYRLREARAIATNTASDFAQSIERTLQQALNATYALATLVRQGSGSVSEFERVATEMLPLYPGATELALAPGGIIRSVVPLAGNEMALDLDLLHDPVQKKESVLARDSGKLTLAGPLDLIQGGGGLVGRMPVFLRDSGGTPYFWGFTLVVIPIPDVLRASNLPDLVQHGYGYELGRIHPDSGTRQTIAASSSAGVIDPVICTLHVPNSAWTLSVAPVKGWGDPLGLSLKAALGTVFSLLLAYLSKLMVEAQVHAGALEDLVARRTAEVRAREEDLTRAQSIAKLGSWVIDVPGYELRFSPETYRILGVSRETPLDFDAMMQRVHAEDRDAVDRAWQGVLHGERCDIEFRYLAGEKVRWLRAQAEPQSSADGTSSRYMGTVEDITQRKRAAEALRAMETEKDRAEERIQSYLWQIQTAFMSTVEVATTLSEMRDPYTAGHERRVAAIAVAIGAELGFDEQRIEGLRVAGQLHDIGKITIPAEILAKPGKLSPVEYELIKGHPRSSHDVLKDVEFPWPVAEVALQHHERIDGSGYPQGLKGEAIAFEARIVAVADVLEAMSSHRPYRPALGLEKALAEIERGRGTAYDAEVADACLRLFREKGCHLPE